MTTRGWTLKQEKRLYYKAKQKFKGRTGGKPIPQRKFVSQDWDAEADMHSRSFSSQTQRKGKRKASLQSAQRVRIEMFVDNAGKTI